jgi:DNA-binding NtrC family response regulator
LSQNTKHKLLIVDDDHGFLDVMGDVFRSFDYDVTCAATPVDAVSEMKRKSFKVVLLDYQLPLVDGSQLISSLQEIEPDARFIVLTGMGGDEIENKFKGRGYYAFFQKGSLQIEDLHQKVQEAFEH